LIFICELSIKYICWKKQFCYLSTSLFKKKLTEEQVL
jgi:hypothetical protein